MRLILLRHGETDWNKGARLQGGKPTSLNETGISQVRSACVALRREFEGRIAAIVTSPLLRAIQSAEICAEHFHMPFVVLNDLRERSFGELEGRTKDDIRRDYDIDDVELVATNAFGIEQEDDVLLRVKRAMDTLRARFAGQTVLAITHGSVIRLAAKSHNLSIGIIPNGSYIDLVVE
ncbi:histidine phosphatase family protein [Alicyclobacillus fastidiosus]|uniref:Histidine phosphatase family protein n=1 Tax=Alicyclobacillus fastidiosus TaxID=392011 RepID=A0ABY6ZFV2_9BACL|nr:histidine phosphatase family protein [Alicyclobacillus fastidiosus]WAH41739.1 histidine phosphatase family protein [Alicyclobacillus fastidiosus]GMA63428.1 phosphoglycerate mutase [Alicyclobacillus fastidiosus]